MYVQLVPQCPQEVLVRLGELPKHFNVESSTAGLPVRSTSVAGCQGPLFDLTFNEEGSAGGAGRREINIIIAGIQIHVERMEPVAARQSLQ